MFCESDWVSVHRCCDLCVCFVLGGGWLRLKLIDRLSRRLHAPVAVGVAKRDGAGHIEAGPPKEGEDGVQKERQIFGGDLHGEEEELFWGVGVG